MAKKKPTDGESDEDFLGFDDDEEESADSLQKKEAIPSKPQVTDSAASKDVIADSLYSQLEEETEPQNYKYLQLALEQNQENEFFLHVKHQSHGFMNYMVSLLLKTPGVSYAAYKLTSLAPAVIYIRIDGTRDIKGILKETIQKMRTEWKGMKNAVAAMKA